MKRLARLWLVPVLPAIAVCVPLTETADGYLDPGTGGVILQMALAGFVGGLFALKLFWGRIRAFFKSLFTRSANSEAAKD